MDNNLQPGLTSIFYKDILGPSNRVSTSKIIGKIPNIVANDGRAKMYEIAEAVSISIERSRIF